MSDRTIEPVSVADRAGYGLAGCPDCHWASVGADPAPFDWMCHAPLVVAMLDGNAATPCRYAREFSTVCGAQGRFFRAREGGINGCLAV